MVKVKMKRFVLFIIVFCSLACAAVEESSGRWEDVGELAYSYAYSRTWLGNRLRCAGWRCTVCFVAGSRGEQEHSVWIRGREKMQMMIWRIDSGKTGYAKGIIRDGVGTRR